MASIEVSPSGKQILVCVGADIALIRMGPYNTNIHLQILTIAVDCGRWYLQEELQRPIFGKPEFFDEPSLIATGAHFIETEKACIASYLHHGMWYVIKE